ncbi:DNA polymerase III subunit gamma/tau [Patescibacteria group bacterium]
MSEISLYRKYRPQNFKNLVGQDHIRTTLLNAIKEGHTAHAYLLCGPRGTGKTSTARLLAKALNCTNPDEECEPCDKCEMCESVREGNLIDLIEIDAASNRGIDEIRDLKDKINFAPSRSKNKIYIIDEVHMLTKEAFNALLKTLEEPPSHVYFVLATTESHKVPETIISRCQRFDFKRISQKAITTRLMYIAQMEEIDAEEAAVETIAHSAEGGLRDAIGLLEQLTSEGKLEFTRVQTVLGISGISALESFYKHLRNNDTNAALTEIQNLYSQGIDLVQFTKDFLEHLRLTMLKSTEEGNLIETNYALNTAELFQEAYGKLKNTTIPQLPLEMAVIRCTMQGKIVAPEPVEVVQAEQKVEEPATPEPEQPKIEPERTHAPIKTNISEQERENPVEKLPLTIAYVKENWPRVIEVIKTPFVRMSFKAGKPIKVENGEVLVEFTSNFHKEKVDTTENRLEIEKAIDSIFAGPAKVNYAVSEVKLSTPKPEVTEEQAIEPPEPEVKEEGPDLANAAMEMFGGELVED